MGTGGPVAAATRLDIATAPLQLLANDAKERDAGERSERENARGFFELDNRAARDRQWFPTVHGQEHGMIPFTYFDFDDGVFIHDDRAIGQHVRTNRRDDKRARFRRDDRTAGGKRIGR